MEAFIRRNMFPMALLGFSTAIGALNGNPLKGFWIGFAIVCGITMLVEVLAAID